MFYIVVLAMIVGGVLLYRYAMRKAEKQGRGLAEQQLRQRNQQGPTGNA